MRTSLKIMFFLCMALVFCHGCKKKHSGHVAQIEADDPYDKEKEGLLPAKKIDPEGEAENPPHLAVADLHDDGSDEEEQGSKGQVLGDESIKPPGDDDYTVGTIGDYQIVRLFAPSFSSMPQGSRILSYHLARAVLAGRDIVFDQIHRDGLEIRQLFECILRLGKNSKRQLDQALRDYYLKFGINYGFYHRLTGKKFVLDMSFEDFLDAVRAAHAEGAHMDLQRDESIDGMLSRLKRPIFDADFQKVFLKGKKSGWQANAIGGGNLNLYKGVRSKALNRFREHYPQNSRLINIEGKLVEEIYRTGDKRRRIAPGRYSKELKRVIGRLQAALAFAHHDQRMVLSDLIEHFRTGDSSSFDSALSVWQQQVWPVEFFMGFLDKSLDYQQRKGIWTGWVGLLVQSETSRIQSMARELNYFEGSMPWDAEYANHWKELPEFLVVELLTGAGSISPICKISYGIPPERSLGERFASKVLFFSNVQQARFHAVIKPLIQHFLATEKEGKRQMESMERMNWATDAIGATLGPSLGKTSQSLGSWIRSDLVVLAKVRSDLVALWLLGDRKLVDLGILMPEDDHILGWKVALVQAAVLDSLTSEQLLDVEARARRVWLRKMIDSGAVEIRQDKDRIFPVITDTGLFRKVLSDMLVYSEKILADGNESMARAFVRKWERGKPWPYRDALAKQAAELGLGPVMVCTMPKLKPLRGDEPGRFVDAKIFFDEEFVAQLLRISRY